MGVRYWVHWFYLPIALCVLTVSVQTALCWIIIRSVDATDWTPTLRISEGFITVTGIRWITLHSVVDSTNLDN